MVLKARYLQVKGLKQVSFERELAVTHLLVLYAILHLYLVNEVQQTLYVNSDPPQPVVSKNRS